MELGAETAALMELFWERLSPATRALLDELASASSWAELAQMWGFESVSGVWDFVHVRLRKRVEREAGAWLVSMLWERIGELQ